MRAFAMRPIGGVRELVSGHRLVGTLPPGDRTAELRLAGAKTNTWPPPSPPLPP